MLELQNISLHVEGDKEILSNINLIIPDDHFIAITGPNGGGKSTLAKVIMGIMQPDTGKVLYQGQDITNMSITERANLGISFSFQQPVRFKGIRVRNIIELAVGRKMEDKELAYYLSEVGLCAKDYLDRPIDDSLSGGEIKRIEIASVMARGAQLSVFDEPEAGIDLWSFQNLIQVFTKMRKEHGGTIVVISHQERILAIADKIIVIADGHIVSEGEAAKMLPDLQVDRSACDCVYCIEQEVATT